MKNNLLRSFLLALSLGLAPLAFADSTAFTWQGKLTDAGQPANGSYDLRFTLHDSLAGGAALGTNTLPAAAVSNGLYTATLDFGAAVFNGDARWLELALRTNGAADFTTLAPRQAVTPTPYAIRAANAGSVSGTIPDAQLSANVARLNATNTFTGPVAAPSFAGSGASLSGVAPASGSTNYVSRSGDSMTGSLHLPGDGLTAGSNQLFLSGGNVGIGTGNPQRRLHLSRPVGIEELFEVPDASADGRFWRWIARSSGYFQGDLFNDALTDATTWIQARRDGMSLVNVSFPNGNVGIGTTTPNAPLQIGGYQPGLKYRGLIVQGGFSETNERQQNLISFGTTGYFNSDPFNDTGPETVKNWHLGVVTDTAYYNYDRFSLVQNGVERMSVNSSGNVGIGTTSPSNKFVVSDTGQILSFSGSQLSFVNTPDYTGPEAHLKLVDADHNNTRAIIHAQGNAGAVEALWVGSAGNVGIGTTSPNLGGDKRALTVTAGTSGEGIARLEVQGTRFTDNIYGALDFYHKANNTASIASYRSGADDAGNLTFWTKMTGVPMAERMRIANNGNVGIGTDSPQARLHVAEANGLFVSQSGNALIKISPNNATGRAERSSGRRKRGDTP